MGAWGVQIFSNDDACDVRDIYLEKLFTLNDREAEEAAILECKDYDPDILWTALALTEWKHGRLSTEVKEKALQAIDKELSNLDTLWPAKTLERRKKVLTEAHKQLLSQMPKRKKMKLPSWAWKCPWAAGNVLQYKICYAEEPFRHLVGQYVLLPVISVSKIPPQTIPCEALAVGLCDWIGQSAPDQAFIESLELIPFTFLGGHTKKTITVTFDSYTIKESDIKCVGSFPVSRLQQYYGESVTVSYPTNGLFTQSLCFTFSK